MAKIVATKVFLTLTTYFNRPIVQIDVNNVFINEGLFEEVYITLPMRYKTSKIPKEGEKLACCLNKSIYGHEQASRQ